MMRLKDVVDVNVLALSNDTSPNFEFKYIDISNVNQFGITQEPEYIVFNEAPSRARRLIKKNDVIVSTVRTYLKAIAFIYFEPKDYVVSTGFAVLQPKKNIFPKYLGYYCQSEYFIDKVVSNSKGVSYPAINAGEIVQLPIINLPHSEQQAIANYLDAKTSAIDKKVTLLEQKIETYKKLKRTLINQTITKGLRSLSEVEMKDSGISWIGQIPQHWEVKRLKDVVKIVNGYAFKSNDFSDDGLSVLRISDITKSDFSDLKKVPLFYKTLAKESKVLREDILMAMTGATIGKNSFFNGNDTLYLNQRVCSFRAINKNQLLPFYFSLFISSDFVQNLIKLIAGGSAQENISKSQLEVFEIVLPPKSEQEEIANYLDSKTATIDAIVGNITKQIETLKQLRKTLINDVVTGKIKVVN